ncbi:MAG: hypothetical protein A2W91_20135 [Bacteroidetes bacterium GWF2_38_335]|nr:MAG: hypothetical protein A2W91_20135 [Bacteroidetes bacterium GWF2_38_335]OFY81972.1 MAG: hypothetical protein A2281_09785 [Bacteroidetes bacterium RIFOXYA12_FULL_38_20]HBS86530.1 hypothetical protein [Bacteroidales bacterium]
MDIVARKLNFVQEFLRISDDDLIDKLENFLRAERKKRFDQEFKPMSVDSFNEMIDKSEEDIKNGKVTEAKKLLKKVDKWK